MGHRHPAGVGSVQVQEWGPILTLSRGGRRRISGCGVEGRKLRIQANRSRGRTGLMSAGAGRSTRAAGAVPAPTDRTLSADPSAMLPMGFCPEIPEGYRPTATSGRVTRAVARSAEPDSAESASALSDAVRAEAADASRPILVDLERTGWRRCRRWSVGMQEASTIEAPAHPEVGCPDRRRRRRPCRAPARARQARRRAARSGLPTHVRSAQTRRRGRPAERSMAGRGREEPRWTDRRRPQSV